MTFAIAFTPVNTLTHTGHEWQPTDCWEHVVQQIHTQVLSLVCYLGGLAEGQRVVLVRELGSRAGELHSLQEEQKDYPHERTEFSILLASASS